MTIENSLDELPEGEKKQEPEPTSLIQPGQMFPTEKVIAVYKNFRAVFEWASGYRTILKETSEIISAYEAFKPNMEFYRHLRDDFDHIGVQFKDWNACFEGLLNPELLNENGRAVKTPDSLKNWLVEEIEVSFKELDGLCDEQDSDNKWMLMAGGQINGLLTDLHNATSVPDVVMTGRALCAKIAQVNDWFTIYMVPAADRPPISADRYLHLIDRIYDFAKGKTRIKYEFCNNRVEQMYDISPKPPRKKIFGIL